MVFGVIGDPVAHSLSPPMQNYFMKKLKINGVYCAFHVAAEDLESCLRGARAMHFTGLNVTLPHKQAAARLARFASPQVDLLQVANTLSFEDDGSHAFTTDPNGFAASLGREQERFAGAKVVIFGAGGSARSIVYALSQLGISGLTIVNRIESKAALLAQFCLQRLAMTDVQAVSPNHPDLDLFIDQAAVLINATALGMHPLTGETPLQKFTAVEKKHFVYDLIYNPPKTRFLFEAEKRGATVRNGLEMLIHQGLKSLNIWMQENFAMDENTLSELKSLLSGELQ